MQQVFICSVTLKPAYARVSTVYRSISVSFQSAQLIAKTDSVSAQDKNRRQFPFLQIPMHILNMLSFFSSAHGVLSCALMRFRLRSRGCVTDGCFTLSVIRHQQGRSQPVNEVYEKKKDKGGGGRRKAPFSWETPGFYQIFQKFILQINGRLIPYLQEIQNTIDLNASFATSLFILMLYIEWYIPNGFFYLFFSASFFIIKKQY